MTRHLDAQGAVERLDVLGPAEEQGRQVVQAGQLARGVGVVVDAQVGQDAAAVVAGSRRPGEDGRTLPAARVPAGGVPGEQRRDQSVVEPLAAGDRARPAPSPRSPLGPVRMLPWIAYAVCSSPAATPPA